VPLWRHADDSRERRVADAEVEVISTIEEKSPGLVALQVASHRAHQAWESYTQRLAQQGKHGWEWTPTETSTGKDLFDTAIAATAEKETALRNALTQHPDLKQLGYHLVSQALKQAARDAGDTA
jgi:hypothetical protein